MMVNDEEFHCKLAVEAGDVLELDRFTSKIPFNGEWFDFSFNAFLPMPPALQHVSFNSPEENWSSWRKEHWGVLSEPLDGQDVTLNGTSTVINFVTLTGYPLRFVFRMSWQFPSLRFTLFADNGRERNISVWKGGQLRAVKQSAYESRTLRNSK